MFIDFFKIECHLYLNHIKLRTYCIQNSIVVISYNSFAKQKNSNPENKDIFKDKRIIEIAERYNKTPAQIALKYNIQLENVVISEICKKEKLIENIKIFDFYLAPEDMRYLKTFSKLIKNKYFFIIYKKNNFSASFLILLRIVVCCLYTCYCMYFVINSINWSLLLILVNLIRLLTF